MRIVKRMRTEKIHASKHKRKKEEKFTEVRQKRSRREKRGVQKGRQ